MPSIRFLTSGESHGKALIGIIEGIPSNIPLSSGDIERDLQRRQKGHGRGGRMKIESDRAEILSGVRWGKTIGSPVAIQIMNRDWKNWEEGMSPLKEYEGSIPPVTRPRPGHADMVGTIKYNHRDIRNVLERSSARETTMRVALGAVAKKFLSEFGVMIGSYVIQIGSQKSEIRSQKTEEDLFSLHHKAENSLVRCPDEEASVKMVELIDIAGEKGDTLGGVFEAFAIGLPIGLGTYAQWDKRMDGRFAQALMSIQAIKGVEIGSGFGIGRRFGSEVMDEIYYKQESGFFRKTNHAGGIEGGITNGMPVILRAVMKPISTLKKPLQSVDIHTKETALAAYERSDVCAVPAASIIAEAMTALVITDAFLEKFGGDSIEETKRNYESYRKYVSEF